MQRHCKSLRQWSGSKSNETTEISDFSGLVVFVRGLGFNLKGCHDVFVFLGFSQVLIAAFRR